MTPSRIAELRVLARADVWWTNAAPVVGECLDEIERLRRIADAARRVAYRGEHTGDCIGASGGACFEDHRDECKCGLTALRNALKGSE